MNFARKTAYLAFLTYVILGIPTHLHAQIDSIHAPIANSANRRHILVFPIIVRSIETSWSFGAAASLTFNLKFPRDSATRTSNLQLISLYTLDKQFIVILNGVVYFPGERYILTQQFSYSYFPDKFWGLGKTSPDSNLEPYSYKQYYIYLHPKVLLGHSLFLGMRYEYQKLINIRYVSGGLFDKEKVVGKTDYHVSGLGLSITYDTRNNAFWPDRGNMFQCYFSHFNPAIGSDYQYTNFVIDLRKFILLNKRQVLAIQAYGYFNSGEVPLRSLASFGGANNMRGYYSGRYRDKNEADLQTEFRVPLFWRLGVVAFGGVGNVGANLSDLNFDHLKYSYGGGLRLSLNKAEKLNLRMDYGIGRGSSRGFYFQLGEAF